MPEKARSKDFCAIHTLDGWTHVWLQEILPNVVKETTIRMYAETMERHVLGSLGKQRIEDITEQTVEDWMKKLQSTPIAGTKNGCMTEGTVRNTLSVLSGCMRDAQKYGLIQHNPCIESAWTLKSKNVEERREWLDEGQVRQLEPLLAAYQDEDGYPLGLGFQLVLYTGITLSEAVALRWEDVDFEEETLHLRYFVALKWKQGSKEGKKQQELERLTGRKRRDVPVPGFLMRRLSEVQKEYGGKAQAFVLGGSETEPVRMDRMRAALMRKGRACGLGTVTPRMLRDTYAMRAVHAGANSDMIAEMMGFASSRQVIRRYMPKEAADKRELVNKMFCEV